MKVALVVLAVVVVLLVLLEVGLRLLFGFGNPLTYITDEQIGYLLAPSQQTRRFGNRIEINQYSMRSADVSPTRPTSTLRVLLLGDSIANGGWWTDQANIMSEMMARQLKSAVAESVFQDVEVLNASANSWGPRNELAYLQRFGTFDSQAIVLLINTDDLFATAPSSVQVGRDRNYPAKKPPLALVEVFTRYFLPAPNVPQLAKVNGETGDPGDSPDLVFPDRVGRNLVAIEEIQAIARSDRSNFLLAMTPLLREIGNPGPRDYELRERQRLTEFTTSKQITYIDFLPVFNSTVQPESLYRDHIHLSYQGNYKVSEAICHSLTQLLPKLSAITDREEKAG